MLGQHQDLFVSGMHGIHTVRIPSLLMTQDGTVLAMCEGRLHSRDDDGQIAILLRRSGNGGITWGRVQIVVSEPDMTCGNPCLVQCQESGVVWLLFCKNVARRGEDIICRGEALRTVWLTASTDDGETWSSPEEITAEVKQHEWTWYATGPGHGIQLAGGRLVVPCDHVVGQDYDRGTDPHHAHVIVSDDGGKSWRAAGVIGQDTNECAVVELSDGSVYLNARGNRGTVCRAVTRSLDQGESFDPLSWDETLIEPICQGSLIRHPNGITFFANPAGRIRERLTLRASSNDCQTWNAGHVLQAGPAAYSDLAIAPDGSVLCLFERGVEHPYERLTLARLDVVVVTGE
jgi:sialidase-1